MNSVIVFLCTPRCGTQWFVKNLSSLYSNEAVIMHEPIKNNYYLKVNLGKYEKYLKPSENLELEKHLNFIEEVTKEKKYIEIGWQSIGGISQLYRRFGDNLKLIHLYRNPINIAASLVTHDWYSGEIEDRHKKSELNPFDEGAILSSYKEKWRDLSMFEKSIYFWTEINLRALEIKYRYNNVPFYQIKFEDLFTVNKETSRICLVELMAFMGLDYKDKMLNSIDTKYDKFHQTTHLSIDWKRIKSHPMAITLANKLGYSFEDEINLNRYEESYFQFVKKNVKKHLPERMVKFYRASRNKFSSPKLG